MKRNLLLAPLIVLAAACNTVEPNAGHQAVLTMKPWFAGHEGVYDSPISSGRTYLAWSTDATDVNMLPQRTDMEFDDMMTKTGVPVNFHVVLTWQVIDSVKLVKSYGADVDNRGNWGFFLRNLDQPIRTAVRDSVKKYDMQEIALTQTAADQVQNDVVRDTLTILAATGVPIKVLPNGVTVGRILPPDAIKTQRIATAEQEQRQETEKQRKLAVDQRKQAEMARAEADNAYNEKMRLNPGQYIELERIKMLQEVCKSGKCIFLNGPGTPLLNVGQ